MATAAHAMRAGLVSLDRAVLEATGPQRQKLLQGLLSHEVVALAPGQGRLAALLSVKGGVQALVRVLVEESLVAVEANADRLDVLQATLEHYRVAAPVRFTRPSTAVLALVGARADEVARAAGADPPAPEPESHVRATVAGRALRLVRATDLPGGGLVAHVDAEGAATVREALLAAGASPLEPAALDALRVEALRPWYGSDVTEENLLHEAGLVGERHSPAKGCYLGQEVIARLEARGGHVSRALRGLRLSAPAATGDTITHEGREVGRVTTAGVSPRFGPVAMGYVHRSAFAPGTAVEVAGAPARVVSRFEPLEE
jgi:folate-binding protein YgfZ